MTDNDGDDLRAFRGVMHGVMHGVMLGLVIWAVLAVLVIFG